MLRLALLCALVAIVHMEHDATMTPNVAGSSVVEKVSELLQENCIFGDDKLFTRRVAFVETLDGKVPGTFRSGYHGGIWKVDENMFKKTQVPAIFSTLGTIIDSIRTEYKIEWSQMTWEDCRKPLVSALAQKLYIKAQTNTPIPRDIPGQATFWKNHYRQGGNTQTFIDDCKKLSEACPAGKVDIVFVLDGSGSVGSTNFAITKKFVYDVVNSFTIGSNNTRVALVKYDSRVYNEFYLNNTYMDNKGAMLSAINGMSYPGGGTNTYDAIDHVVNSIFQTKNGARNSDAVPRVAIIMTDGRSIVGKVQAAAARAHNAGITMFAVGIGSNINHAELDAIASEPKCFHKFELSGFNEVESLRYAIEKGSCDAPIIVNPRTYGSEIDITLPPGGDVNCKIKVPANGVTVKVKPKTGSATFYIANDTYPSDAYYEAMAHGRPGYPGVLYITNNSGLTDDTIFCNIKGNETEETDVETVIDVGDTDRCKDSPCKHGSTCIDEGKDHKCECITGVIGDDCGTNTDRCKDSPCKHGSTCIDEGKEHKCECVTGTIGDDCGTIVNNCASSPCSPNGKCQNSIGKYKCNCEEGWIGAHCQNERTYDCTTNSNPCSAESVARNGHYFEHTESSKFIHCGAFGECVVKVCGTGLVWDPDIINCNWP